MNRKPKIVVLDGNAANPGDLDWAPIASQGEFAFYERTPPDLVVKRAQDAHILIDNKVTLSAELLEQLPRLRYIGLLSTGYNVVDIAAAARLGIPVCNVPDYSSDSVAQLTFALLLESAMSVAAHNASVQAGDWCACPDFCYRVADITELAGKTLGVVGYGHIGRKTAAIARAFGMRVLAYARRPFSDDAYARYATLTELFAGSDAVSLHCPLTAETDGLIDDNALTHFRRGAILINTARGGLVDEQAVARALNAGILSRYCADVLSEEPPRRDNPLLGRTDTLLTPHIAWASADARRRLIDAAADNIRAFLEGHPQNNVWENRRTEN